MQHQSRTISLTNQVKHLALEASNKANKSATRTKSMGACMGGMHADDCATADQSAEAGSGARRSSNCQLNAWYTSGAEKCTGSPYRAACLVALGSTRLSMATRSKTISSGKLHTCTPHIECTAMLPDTHTELDRMATHQLPHLPDPHRSRAREASDEMCTY